MKKEQREKITLRDTTKKWKKSNKNHYPDSDWVWSQLENNVTGEKLYNAIDKK